MTDLPHLATRLYGTPLLIARPKLDVIRATEARVYRGEAALAIGLADRIGNTRDALAICGPWIGPSPRPTWKTCRKA